MTNVKWSNHVLLLYEKPNFSLIENQKNDNKKLLSLQTKRRYNEKTCFYFVNKILCMILKSI